MIGWKQIPNMSITQRNQITLNLFKKKNGLISGCKNSDSEDIVEVMNELGYSDPFPFSRKNVTYCHIDAEYVKMIQGWENNSFNANKAVVVIDISKVNHPIYLADMSFITDLIDYKYAGPSNLMHAETPEESIELYKESIQKVNCPKDIQDYTVSDKGHAELIVDGNIPQSAIFNVIY